MAASLQNLLKPARFEAEPDSPKAAKQLKHWLKVFTSFLERYEKLNRTAFWDLRHKLKPVTFVDFLITHDIDALQKKPNAIPVVNLDTLQRYAVPNLLRFAEENLVRKMLRK